jgi:K+-sensing histidine kinase KdpD
MVKVFPNNRLRACSKEADDWTNGFRLWLGLAIVQDVVEAYGWHLQITRSDLGGARVTITPHAGPNSRVTRARETA